MAWLTRLDRRLAPTEAVSTAILWLLAILAAATAIWGGATMKAALAAWMVLP